MASKVNTRFVVILVGSLLALAIGVGALAAYSLRMSGERNIATGDRLVAEAEQALAAGDRDEAIELFGDAAGQYGRAVSKDRTRRDWLSVWRDTLLRTIPDTDVEYAKQYRERYMGALDQFATLDPTSPGPQLELVLAQDRLVRVSGGAQALNALVSVIDRRVASLPEESPTAMRLRALRGLAQTDRATLESVDNEIRERARRDMEAFYIAFKDDPQPFLTPLGADATVAESDEFAELAREDHERIAIGLVRWHINERAIAQSEGLSQAATEQLRQAAAAIDRVMDDGMGYEQDPVFMMLKTQIELQDATDRISSPAERQRAQVALVSESVPRILDALRAMDAEDLPFAHIARIAQWPVPSEIRAALASELERGIDATPADGERLIIAAQAMRGLEQPERALELYGRVRELPLPELSLEGLLLPQQKLNAAFAQVEINLDLHGDARAEGRTDAAAEYLAQARAARDVLERESGIATRQLRLRADAEIAIAEGETTRAIRLLEEFRKDFGDAPEVLGQLSRLLLEQGTTGEAKQLMERLVSAGNITPRGVILLADIYRSEGDLDLALEMLETQASRSTTPEEFTEVIEQTRRLIAIQEGEESDDPVLAAAVRANEAIARRDFAEAISILDRAESDRPEAAQDLRFVVLRTQIDMLSGNREAALDRIERALARDPGNQTLERMRSQLGTGDIVADRLAAIDSSDQPAIDKALDRYSLLSSIGRDEEARRAIDEAESIRADHPRVLDIRFTSALADEDFEAASRIASRAGEANADGVDGLLYQGRLQMARGNRTEAVRTLRTAVGMIPSSVQIRRYLGQALVQNGQIDEGVEYLRRAHEAQRSDLQVLGDYVLSLRRLGRVEEARAVLDPQNDPSAPARASRTITNLWLTLEAETGNSDRALNERRTYFRADLQTDAIAESAESRENALRLIELLVNQSVLEEAEEVLASIEAHLSANERTRAQAGIALGRAARLTDPEQVRAAEEEAIADFRERAEAEAENSRSPGPLLEVADFAFDSGRFDLGIEILESAIRYESETERRVSRELARRLGQRASRLDNEARALEAQAEQREASDPLGTEAFSERAAQARGRATASREEAATVYTDILSASSAGVDFNTRLSLAELRLQLGQFTEAEELIERVRSQDSDNLNALLLAASLAEQRDNRPLAGRLYDQTVEKHPTNFLPFYRRALFHSADPARRADVLFDLRRVAELRPSLTEAWVLRYRVHMQNDDPDSAFAALRDGIEAAASNTEPLSRQLVQELNRFGRVSDAATVAADRARENPDDPYWLFTAGSLARQRGSMTEAADFFARLMEVPSISDDSEQHAQAAGLYLDALLRSERSIEPRQVSRLAALVESAEAEGATAVSRGMLLARAYATVPSERSRANALIQQAYRVAAAGSDDASTTQLLRLWFQDLAPIVGGGQAALDYVVSLDNAIRQQKAQDPDSDIAHPVYIRTLVLQADQLGGAAPSELIPRAEALLEETENDPVARYEIHKRLSNLKYAAGDIAGAAEEGREALAINGRDLEMLNNVAFFLAKYLDRVEEAVPYAERAAQLAPENADVLDTVGVVYMLSGDYSRAASTLQLALRFARTQEQRLPANVHMADTLIRSEDPDNARQYLETAERLLPVVTEAIRSTYAPEVSELRSRLNNP